VRYSGYSCFRVRRTARCYVCVIVQVVGRWLRDVVVSWVDVCPFVISAPLSSNLSSGTETPPKECRHLGAGDRKQARRRRWRNPRSVAHRSSVRGCVLLDVSRSRRGAHYSRSRARLPLALSERILHILAQEIVRDRVLQAVPAVCFVVPPMIGRRYAAVFRIPIFRSE
jgi:hypothetical protein